MSKSAIYYTVRTAHCLVDVLYVIEMDKHEDLTDKGQIVMAR